MSFEAFLSDCVKHFGTRCLYEVLNVAEGKSATDDQIKAAYKQACLKLHPDKTPEGSTPENTARFQLVQRAYVVLSDPQRRDHYDRTGQISDDCISRPRRENWSWGDFFDQEIDEEDDFFTFFPFPFFFHSFRSRYRPPPRSRSEPDDPPGDRYDSSRSHRRAWEWDPFSTRESRPEDPLAGADFTTPFGDLADVMFSVEGKRLYFNRDFLAKRSEVLAKMFQAAGEGEVIKLEKLRYDDVLAALKLLVASKDGGQQKKMQQVISKENVERLLGLSVKLELKEVRGACEHFVLAEWQVRENEILEAILLSEKFSLEEALKDLLAKLSDHYSSIVRDKNIEQVLTIAAKYKLENVLMHCEQYILKTWKHQPDKFVRAVELAGKFGLAKALANLFNQSGKAKQAKITDGNVEELLSLAKQYGLGDVRSRGEDYIMAQWIRQGEKALRAVKIGHEMNLPRLIKAFIPLAAKRPMGEIYAQKENLPSELYSAILQSAGLLNAEGVFVGLGRGRPRNAKNNRSNFPS